MDYFKKNRKILLLALLWMSLFFIFWLLSAILLPFILAALLAYVLNPLVNRIALPRSVSVLLIYGCMGVIIYLFSILFLPEFFQEFFKLLKTSSETVNNFKEGSLQELVKKIDSFIQYYQFPFSGLNFYELFHNLLNQISEFIRAQSAYFVLELQLLIQGILGFLFNLMLVFMISGFILVDPKRIQNFIFKLVPESGKAELEAFLSKIDRGLSGVVRGQLIICAVNACLTLTGLLILKIKFALILATLAGLFSLIPIFGSIMSTIPIALVALMSSPITCLLAIAWIIGIHALEANFLNPKILGSSAKIHPIIIVLALVAGEHFYGVFGALLSVPIASIILTLFESLLNKAHTYGR